MGKPLTEAHKQKLREAMLARIAKDPALMGGLRARAKLNMRSGEQHHNWKGDNPGYASVHEWMERWYGKPKKCACCGTESAKVFDWANISGKYLRDSLDWERLCRSCHMKKDGRGAALSKRMREALNEKSMV